MEETLNITDGTKSISFTLRYSKRKTLGISVSPEAVVTVTAPEGLTPERVLQAVKRRMPWIVKQVDEAKQVRFSTDAPAYESGQTLKYLGRDYMLRVNEVPEYEEEGVTLEHRVLRVDIRDRNQPRRVNLMVDEWYRNEALVHLAGRFETLYQKVKKYGIAKPQYYLRRMEKRWGSCSPNGTILLNPALVTLPTHCIDYAIMHELCHLKHADHSQAYFYFLDTVMPDWKERERDLLALQF